MATLTKREIVLKIGKDTGFLQRHVQEVVQRTLDEIAAAIASGRNVELRDFGVFEVRTTAQRIGRRPDVAGSEVIIPPRKTVRFKVGRALRVKLGQPASIPVANAKVPKKVAKKK